MSKKEFLDVLTQSLAGEVSSEIIDDNIKYYDKYISTQSSNEEDVIRDLGDPRLIAKSIIESDRAARAKNKNQGSYNKYSGYYEQEKDNSEERDKAAGNRHMYFTANKWYHKLLMAFVLIILLVTIIYVGKILIGFLFAFGVPIILVLLILSLFRKR